MGNTLTSLFWVFHDSVVETEFLVSERDVNRTTKEFVVLVSAKQERFQDPFNPNRREKNALEDRARLKLFYHKPDYQHNRVSVGLHIEDGEIQKTLTDMIIYKVMFRSTPV